MREDEKQPLSKGVLQKKLWEEAKFSMRFSLIPLLFVTLLAVLFTGHEPRKARRIWDILHKNHRLVDR